MQCSFKLLNQKITIRISNFGIWIHNSLQCVERSLLPTFLQQPMSMSHGYMANNIKITEKKVKTKYRSICREKGGGPDSPVFRCRCGHQLYWTRKLWTMVLMVAYLGLRTHEHRCPWTTLCRNRQYYWRNFISRRESRMLRRGSQTFYTFIQYNNPFLNLYHIEKSRKKTTLN